MLHVFRTTFPANILGQTLKCVEYAAPNTAEIFNAEPLNIFLSDAI